MKSILALVVLAGFSVSARACTIDGGCDCPIPHAAMASEPAFVMTGGGSQSLSPTVVHVFNFEYSTAPQPGPLVDAVINAGESVQWLVDNGIHSVKSVAGSSETFDSGIGFTTLSHAFNTPGVYQYYCALHGFDNGNGTAGGMSGTVTVLAVPEPTTSAGILAGAFTLLRRRK